MTCIRHFVGFVAVAILLLPMAVSCSNQKPAGGKTVSDSYNRGLEARQHTLPH
jgi:hypothetical protein